MRKSKFSLPLLAFMLLILLTSCGDSWFETYDPDADDPYGTSLLPKILQAQYPDAEYVRLSRNWTVNGIDSSEGTLYFAIGNGLSYTPSEAEALASFIESGGDAVLAVKEVSNKFLRFILPDSCLAYKALLPLIRLDSLEQVSSAQGNSFLLPVIRKMRGSSGSGNYISGESYCFDSVEHLLMLQADTTSSNRYDAQGLPIMTRFPYGAGHLTILSYPKVLTNVYATDTLGRIAINEVLKLLPQSVSTVAFDHKRRSPEFAVVSENLPKESEAGGDETNILKHVLARPPLATAWYLLLLGAIVFLVFGAKRRQRLIPLIQPRKNTTHEHLGNISRLYLSQPNNALMAGKQFALFEAYCNRRFGLRPLQDDKDFERFSKMAGVNPQHLETLKRYQSTVARNQPISNTGFVSIVRILQAIYQGIGRRFD